MSIILIATLTVDTEQRDKALELVRTVVPEVHAEAGCELYAPHTSGKDKIIFVEQWTDRESLETHATGPALARLNAGLSVIAPEAPHVQALRPAFHGNEAKGVLVGREGLA